MASPIAIRWACPKCGASANGHGRGECEDRRNSECQGFICECDGDTSADHGETFADVCHSANCYHCGWNGSFPQKPKGLQAWEKKALDAGWTPPDERRKQLGLSALSAEGEKGEG